jgi:hypothetical protein
VLPALVGLGAVSVATTVAGAIVQGEDQMLSELVELARRRGSST